MWTRLVDGSGLHRVGRRGENHFGLRTSPLIKHVAALRTLVGVRQDQGLAAWAGSNHRRHISPHLCCHTLFLLWPWRNRTCGQISNLPDLSGNPPRQFLPTTTRPLSFTVKLRTDPPLRSVFFARQEKSEEETPQQLRSQRLFDGPAVRSLANSANTHRFSTFSSLMVVWFTAKPTRLEETLGHVAENSGNLAYSLFECTVGTTGRHALQFSAFTCRITQTRNGSGGRCLRSRFK